MAQTIQLGVGEGLRQAISNGQATASALTGTSADSYAYLPGGAANTQRVTLFFPITVPDAIRRKIITGLTMRLEASADTAISARLLREAYNAAKISAGEALGEDEDRIVRVYDGTRQTKSFSFSANRGRIANGIAISKTSLIDAANVYYRVAAGAQARPEISVTYEDATVHAGELSPGAGSWIAPNAEAVFTWRSVPDGATLDPIKWASVTVEWKDGPDGAVHTVTQTASPAALTGTTTFAAGTFPSTSQLMIRWTITTEDGVTDPSPEWITFTTADPVPTVTGVSPRNSYFSDGADVTFAWEYSITTGTLPTAYEIQARAAGTDTWEDVASGSGSATTATVASSSLPSGIVEWRVRAANSQGVYSAWSAPLTFSAITAPGTPTVTVERAAPVPVIGWVASGQQGYRIKCGAYDSGPVYGTGKRAELPVVLDDGTHTVSVQITNSSGIWSEWGEAAFTVANTAAGDAAEVAATSGIDAALAWNAVTVAVRYDVLRDGVKIGETTETEYLDRTHPGEGTYVIRTIFADGSYSVSAGAEASADTDGPVIAALGGEWLPIKLSDRELPGADETLGAGIVLVQLAGAKYPTAIRTAQRSHRYAVQFATTVQAEADAFEALIGEDVIVRDQFGRCIVGVMAETARSQNAMMIVYTATVEEVDHEDV